MNNKGNIYGYIRVSTTLQNDDRQWLAMDEFGVARDLPLLDTRERWTGDLTGILISDIVLQLFSYVAQTEREMNHQRTMEGIAAAKARGVQFGRKPMEKPMGFEAVREAWERQEISEAEAAWRLRVSRFTFHKWTHE